MCCAQCSLLWAAYHPPDLVTGLNIISQTASMQFVLYFPYGECILFVVLALTTYFIGLSAIHTGAPNVPVSTV
jgi:hypothetical protein